MLLTAVELYDFVILLCYYIVLSFRLYSFNIRYLMLILDKYNFFIEVKSKDTEHFGPENYN